MWLKMNKKANIILTHNCNLTCKHCYLDAKPCKENFEDNYRKSIEIIDKTIPLIDYTEIEKEKSLKAIYYKEMITELGKHSSDSKEYETLLKALKYGLAALGDRDLTNEV